MTQPSLGQTMKAARFGALACAAMLVLSCAKQTGTTGSGGTATSTTRKPTGTTSTKPTGSTSTGMSPCAMDCSTIQTQSPCLKAVCNTGMYQGAVGTCVVVPNDGASCDDGQFCTTKDTCMNGTCVGGPPNDCGMTPPACSKVTCDETAKACTAIDDPAQEEGDVHSRRSLIGRAPSALSGACVGTAKDCSFDPDAECNIVACDPTSGDCKMSGPDASKNGTDCQYTGNLCNDGKTCLAGMCQGGTPKDCSSLTHDCVVGECTTTNGMCTATPIPAGGMCASATDACNQGICDTMGDCNPMQLANGTACNNHNACMSNDQCSGGMCLGTPITGCKSYYVESFETCPARWTLTGDWQCSIPTAVGPPAAEQGQRCVRNEDRR